MSKAIFVTGIGTDVGKTIVSAILVECMQADYWKPVQAGDLQNSDTIKVQQLVSNTVSVFHPEAYRLTQPYSPHKAAALDGVEIDISQIIIPQTSNQLIIEGAGGLMVPLNDTDLMIDLIAKLDADVVLVSRNYLGSINHTLLSVEVLTRRGINIRAIVFNGDADAYTQDIIQKQTRHAVPLYHVANMPVISKESVLEMAESISFTI
ncbi:MAG: dethiobiotin synthase [Bacteroidota bacterium]